MEVKNLLDEEIKRMLSHIASLEYGTDEREAEIKELNTLYTLRIDEEKLEQEREEECARQKAEDDSKCAQLAENAIDRKLRYGMMLLEVILPILAYGRWLNKGFRFEETGVVSSPWVRNLITKLPLRKK